MIPESFIQELLARIDITDVVGRYVNLRKGGANLLGLCPFHNEKSPSFTVSPTKQFYHCFGCGAHGTAITFLIQHTGASFPEAVRSLASSVGLVVPQEERSPRQTQEDRRRREEVSQHEQVLERARQYYARQLKGSESAIRYLKQRGLTGETAAAFGLGWSGPDRRGLAAVFPDYENSLLVESGLVIAAEDGRRYDRFRERIMFPIRNSRGRLIGFGGRIVGKGEPKYLNSPETPLFSKGHELYGLWEGRAGIRKEGFVLVVEGYMDVVGLAQHGLWNAVATLGTATTPHHIQKLVRVSSRIVFSFDGDKAGRRAAWKALLTCLPLVRDDVSMRFLFLPGEHDPDSYVRELGIEAFRETVAEAVPLSRFFLDELASRHAMNEAEGRAACVHEAAPLLLSLPDSTLRVQIEREFARMVLLTPEELAVSLAQAKAKAPVNRDAQSRVTPAMPLADGLVPLSELRGQRMTVQSPVSRQETAISSRALDEPEGFMESGFQGLSDESFQSASSEPPDWYDSDAEPHLTPPEWLSSQGADGDGHSLPPWADTDAHVEPYRGPDRAPVAGGPYMAISASGKGAARRGGFSKRQRKDEANAAGTMRAPPGAARAVTPMAKRVLRLLFAHPGLVAGLGDQQLEILEHGPHMVLVKDLITLIHTSAAEHSGALLQAADPDSELHDILLALSAQVIGQDDLPDPQAEWNDALRRIEIDTLKAEQSALIAAGLGTEVARERYKELSRRLALISGIGTG